MTKRPEGTCGRILCFVVLAAWHDRRAVRFSLLRLVRIFSLACHDPDESLRLFREMLLKQLPQAENFVKFAMVSPFRLMKRDVAVLEIDRIFKTQNLNAYEKSLYQCRFVFIVPWQRVRFLQG